VSNLLVLPLVGTPPLSIFDRVDVCQLKEEGTASTSGTDFATTQNHSYLERLKMKLDDAIRELDRFQDAMKKGCPRMGRGLGT
jgi:hypothetical protein